MKFGLCLHSGEGQGELFITFSVIYKQSQMQDAQPPAAWPRRHYGVYFDGIPLEARPEFREWLNKRFRLVLCGSRALQSLWSTFRSHSIAVLSSGDVVPANPTFIVFGKVSLWAVQCYRMRGIVNLADRFRSKKLVLTQNPNAFPWISSLCFFSYYLGMTQL